MIDATPSTAPGHESVGVLLVDDEVDALDEMRLCLEDRGQRCPVATSVGQALDVWRSSQPIGVVVTDVRMADADGLTLLRRIAEDVWPRPECVVITGHGSVEIAVQALRLQVVDLLRKPFQVRELAAAVEHAMDRYRARTEAPPHPVPERALSAATQRLTDLIRRALLTLSTPDRPPLGGNGDENFVDTLRRAIDERILRHDLFRDEDLPEAGFDMLLELLLAQVEGRSVYVRNLCAASRLPAQGALRRLADLERLDYVRRTPDLRDKRRITVDLTRKGELKMVEYVRGIGRGAGG